MSQSRKELTYRELFTVLGKLPERTIPLVVKILTIIGASGQKGEVHFTSAVEAFWDSTKTLAVNPLEGLEGVHVIPEIDHSKETLLSLPGLDVSPEAGSLDPDFRLWELDRDISARTPEVIVEIKRAEPNSHLSRYIAPDGPEEMCLTQAQILCLVDSLKNQLAHVVKGGVFFFYYRYGDNGAPSEVFSIKLVGINPVMRKFRVAVRKASDPRNAGVSMRDAYVVLPRKKEDDNN